MSVEGVGAAVTAGLAASALQKPAGHAGEPHDRCADCGTETIGRFCHNCGNASHVHRTLLHLVEELLHGVMHFDGRVWRTLPLLLFRPGRLTREWCLGKRARYVSPLAMFLFTVFVMFMLVSYAPAPKERPLTREGLAAASLARWNAEVEDAQAALEAAPPEQRAAAVKALKSALIQQAKAEARDENTDAHGKALDNWETVLAQQARSGSLDIDTGDKKLDAKIRHKLEDPEFALYKLQQTFYKFSFLLIPISIPFVALLFFWKREFTLYDHGVFALYSLTFMSILIMALAVANRIGGVVEAIVVAPVPAIVPAHMFFQLKGAYSLSAFSAAWRTVLLLIFCGVALVLFVLAIVSLNLV